MADPKMEKGEFFRDSGRYLYEPFEEAFFYWNRLIAFTGTILTGKIRMKFAREDYDIELPQDHRIFNEAIISGREVTKADYERG